MTGSGGVLLAEKLCSNEAMHLLPPLPPSLPPARLPAFLFAALVRTASTCVTSTPGCSGWAVGQPTAPGSCRHLRHQAHLHEHTTGYKQAYPHCP